MKKKLLVLTTLILSIIMLSCETSQKVVQKVSRTSNNVNSTVQSAKNLHNSSVRTKNEINRSDNKNGRETLTKNSQPNQVTRGRNNSFGNSISSKKDIGYAVDNKNDLYYFIYNKKMGSTFKEATEYERVLSEEEIIAKSVRNIYTFDKNENDYLKKILVYFINNKKWNKGDYECDESKFSYKIERRQSNGMPRTAVALFSYKDISGQPIPGINKLRVEFENGLPFFVIFPTTDNMGDRSYNKGEHSQLIFTKKQREDIYVALKKSQNEYSNHMDKNVYPRINDSLSKLIVKKYPGIDGSKCLVISQKTGHYETAVKDNQAIRESAESGKDMVTMIERATTSYTIENKCNTTLKVVGYHIGSFSNEEQKLKAIRFIERTYKPRQKISFSEDGNGFHFDYIQSGNHPDYINLQYINKQYDINGPIEQYLRIIQIK